MPASILVAYATRYGSTLEVAETVGTALRDQGHAVEVQTARTVRSLEAYSAVVLGAPLYMFRWHADALRFISTHRTALAARPVAIFALGPVQDVEKERLDARTHLDKELAKYGWLMPVAVEVLGGKWDPAKLGFPFNLMGPLKKIPASDMRDWPAIQTWARSLAAPLRLSGS